MNRNTYHQIMMNPGTIDLSKGQIQKHYIRAYKATRYSIIAFITFVLMLICFVLLIGTSKADAEETNHTQDFERKQRVEACYRTFVSTFGNKNIDEAKIYRCASIMTLITAFESNYMSSRMCSIDNNCMGLKGIRLNGTYGDLKFPNKFDGKIYFGQKWWKFHYKKSFFTLIFGYKQKNGTWRFGWATGNKASYYSFIKRNYNKIYKEISSKKIKYNLY